MNASRNRACLVVKAALLLSVSLASLLVSAAFDDVSQARAQAVTDELSIEQARLADRFKRLEEVLGRLAELSTSTDPRRARLLRDAIARSREQDVQLRFESIVRLLEEERLSAATSNQTELHKELDSLLTLLLQADRDRELRSQGDRVREYLKEVGRLIRLQKGVRARTTGGDELQPLSEDQMRLAEDAGQLGSRIAESERDESARGDESDESDTSESDASETDESKSDEPGAGKPGSGESESESKPDDSDAQASPSEGDSGKPADPSENGDATEPGGESSDKPEGESSGEPGSEAESSPKESGEPSAGEPSPGGEPAEPSEGSSPGTPAGGEPGPPGESGSPSDGSGESEPAESAQRQPADRATERLRSAQQKMEQARKKLDEAEREGAAERQREALQELELAKAELERILRQLREEEMERTLTQLAARFRQMLEAQTRVYEDTVRLDRISSADRDQSEEIQAARLSRLESLIVREADKALLLLREEGSSVAFPEAVQQMRDDMREVEVRLAAFKVDQITQGLETDIIAALEETIAALEKALKDLEENRTPPAQAPPPGQPAEPPLVHKLAELKLIRSLQMRINVRTQRYAELIGGDQAETEDLLTALADLATRQQRVYQAIMDLNLGRNE